MRTRMAVPLILLATGCISTNVQHLDSTPRPALEPASVAVLEQIPERPFTVIAVLESTGESVFDTFADLRRELVSETARLGGQALVLGPETTDAEFIFTGLAMIRSDTRRLSGQVIVYDVRE